MAKRAGASKFFRISPRLPREMHTTFGLSISLEARVVAIALVLAVNIESGGVIMQEEYRALTCRSESRLGLPIFGQLLS